MRFILFLFLSISLVASAQQAANTDVITITSIQSEQFDTGLVEWQLSENQIVHYFSTAKQIENKEAAKFISENYYPCSMTGNLNYQGKHYYFIVHTSGVGILRDANGIEQFYIVNDSANHDSFNNRKRDSENLKMFLISQQKYFECEECGEDLCNWCKTWKLTVSDFNDYISLCKQMNHTELYQKFLNYPCALNGYLVWEGQIYYYSLESSAPLWLYNEYTKSDTETIGFGCYDKEGEKYVFEIAIDED